MIAEFLQNHLNAPFPPGARELQIPDADLELLNAQVLRVAQSYVERRTLAPEQRNLLEGCVAQLQRIFPELPDELRDYFARLHALGVAVLNELPVHGPST
ncbi:MAG: hypothetical protein ACREV9_07015 [Burkholderiales bacterium]